MQTERNRRGRLGEELAACLLRLEGCSILQRNVRWADVEVDLVARDGTCLLLVEVKLRQALVGSRGPLLTVRQSRRLVRAAGALLARHAWAQTLRIDVVTIAWHPRHGTLRLDHLRGALADSTHGA